MNKMLGMPLRLIFSVFASINAYGAETAEFALDFGENQPFSFKTVNDFNQAYKGGTIISGIPYAQFRGRYAPLEFQLTPSQPPIPVTGLIKQEDYQKLTQYLDRMETQNLNPKIQLISESPHHQTTFQSRTGSGGNFNVTFSSRYTLIPSPMIGNEVLKIAMELKKDD